MALLVAAEPACAADCGRTAPDYEADRTIRVGQSTLAMHVYVAGPMVREEVQTPSGLRIIVRDGRTGAAVVQDGAAGRTTALPVPPSPARRPDLRTMDEPQADGEFTHVTQLRRGESWIELSRAQCRRDSIMTRQRFVSLDPQGREVEGELVQRAIRVAPVPLALFLLGESGLRRQRPDLGRGPLDPRTHDPE